ncbi:zinc-binding dehydrogenase [Streptomyces sp. NPDC005302]|uniref:zinc-binding dehydrogenase n=1 Tax=Streptomyces sp. NPDC005302 TaxID=3154675 RepID=UPI0033BEB6E7
MAQRHAPDRPRADPDERGHRSRGRPTGPLIACIGTRRPRHRLPARHDTVKALGAEHVLGGRATDLAGEAGESTDGVDLVLESVGQDTFVVGLGVTRPCAGRIIVFGGASADVALTVRDLVFRHRVTAKGLHAGSMGAEAPRRLPEDSGGAEGSDRGGRLPAQDLRNARLAKGSASLADM